MKKIKHIAVAQALRILRFETCAVLIRVKRGSSFEVTAPVLSPPSDTRTTRASTARSKSASMSHWVRQTPRAQAARADLTKLGRGAGRVQARNYRDSISRSKLRSDTREGALFTDILPASWVAVSKLRASARSWLPNAYLSVVSINANPSTAHDYNRHPLSVHHQQR